MLSTRPALIVVALLASRASAAGPEPTVDRKPYAIRAIVDFEPGTRVDAARRSAILDDWRALARRFVGPPWSIEVDEGSASVATASTAIDSADAEALGPLAESADKVWAIRARARGSGLILEGREFDSATGTLGQVHRRDVVHPTDTPRELLRLALAMFAPSADVGESKGGGVSFLVHGASLPSGPLGAVAPAGTVFRALRIFEKPDSSAPEVREIPYSYFRVERLDGATARCEIIKGVGDPLTGRYARKNRLVALGIKPADAPTRLRFLLKGDRQPAAGYRLTARSVGPGTKASDVGTTDRDGRVILRPGFADRLVMLRLLAGNDEPMADIPIMPGEVPDERTIVFEPRPMTLALEARLDALRDAIVDILLIRARLENRMKARLDGEDWPGLDATIREFRALPPRDQFVGRLAKLKEGAERQEAESKALVLTKNARAQLDDTQALIDRYLDDEMIRAYEDAAARAKVEIARAKAEATKPKKAAMRPVTPANPEPPIPRPAAAPKPAASPSNPF